MCKSLKRNWWEGGGGGIYVVDDSFVRASFAVKYNHIKAVLCTRFLYWLCLWDYNLLDNIVIRCQSTCPWKEIDCHYFFWKYSVPVIVGTHIQLFCDYHVPDKFFQTNMISLSLSLFWWNEARFKLFSLLNMDCVYWWMYEGESLWINMALE